MWEEIACLIHNIDAFFAIRNADVHMQTENQEARAICCISLTMVA